MGHTRETETKGIWLWGTPVEKKEADGSSSMVRNSGLGPAWYLSALRMLCGKQA